MIAEKFIGDSKTVLNFIQLYCDDKHKDVQKENETLKLNYKNEDLGVELSYNLCPTCKKTFLYSYERLQKCPHLEKPRCRKCSDPCYEKEEWKKVAKIMKYSGIKSGLLKIKSVFTKS